MDNTLQTGLAPGRYCDVLTGELSNAHCTGRIVEVDANGFAVQLEAMDAIAIHHKAKIDSGSDNADWQRTWYLLRLQRKRVKTYLSVVDWIMMRH